MTTFKRTVSTPNEYRELVRAAETLDFEPIDYHAHGTWVSADGIPAWPKDCTIEKVGIKYFHMPLTTDDGVKVVKCRPDDDAHLVVTFGD